MPFAPSSQQQAYFDFLSFGTGSLVLEAAAGAGKSTTLVHGLEHMSGSIFMGAYNKAAAEDLKKKADKAGHMRKGLKISTMHGAGYGAWRYAAPECKVVETKMYDILDSLAGDHPELATMGAYILRMVALGKLMLAGVKWSVDNNVIWTKLADHFGTTSELPEDVEVADTLDLVKKVFKISAEQCHQTIDFDDMIWAPLFYNARFFKNDWVLIDEAQDTNPSRRELARRMLRPGGRLIAVGDSRQAIYGFTGSDSDALDLIQAEFKPCTRLPLSVTYRCPKQVVAHAHSFVPVAHITAHETAPEGVVRTYQRPRTPETEKLAWFMTEPLAETDAILCRYTKPLVKTAFGMIRAGMACRVEGRDIGRGLIALAQRWKVKSLERLEQKLDMWQEREVRKAQIKRSEAQEQSVRDRRETLQVFIDRCRQKGHHDISCVVAEITALFADDVTGVTTLCTGHKSKGREWPRVYWLQSDDFERPGTQDWQRQQELNVKYVMATRAMDTLVLIPVGAQ